MRTLYQMTRSLFSSETLTLFSDKTSELASESVRGVLSLIHGGNPTHLCTTYLAIRGTGTVNIGGCMFAASS